LSQPLTYAKVPGAEVVRAMNAIEVATAMESDQVIMMACFAMAICIANPGIENEALKQGVKGASEWLAMYIDSLDEPTRKDRMN
jgi:hypothetical protein